MDGYRSKPEREKRRKCKFVESLIWMGVELVAENTKPHVKVVENLNMMI